MENRENYTEPSQKVVLCKIDGVTRVFAVEDLDAIGGYISERASRFLRAQGLDNQLYYGPNVEEGNRLFVSSNGMTRYCYKSEIWLSPIKKGEGWEWKEIWLKIVDMY